MPAKGRFCLKIYAATPNNAPTTAVMPMASAPQKATRAVALKTGAPPMRAEMMPSRIKKIRLAPEMLGTSHAGETLEVDASMAAPRGSNAPQAKLAADAKAA